MISPKRISELNYDKVIIASVFEDEMLNQLIDLGICGEKIDTIFCYPQCRAHTMETIVDVDDRSIIFNMGDIKFKCKTKSDFGVAREIFSGNYNIVWNRKEVTVIDIGMNIGLATLYLASKCSVKNVYSFEPFKETYEQAVRNINMNDKQIANKINTYNLALGNENTVKKFHYMAEFSGGMSILGDDAAEGEDVVAIQVKDASEILGEIINDPENSTIVLKMDCEGSEYNIFESLEKSRLLDKIDIIMMEWHTMRVTELEQTLLKNGFEFFEMGHHDIGYIYAFKSR